MRPPRLALALAAAAALRSGGAAELHVLRSSPDRDASPATSITVTFDRPVAGSLDYTVAAESIVHVSPAIPGRLEWRDPVTVRLTPKGLLASNTTYTVTVSTNFQAMDGSKLAAPFTFSFRVHGPSALTGSPAGPERGRQAENLSEKARFEVVYSMPVDTAALGRAAHLEFTAACKGPASIKLRVVSQRPITDKDDWRYREAGGYQRSREADSLRRVVLFVPEAALPYDCRGSLRVPAEMVDSKDLTLTSWDFAVHGALKIDSAGCSLRDFCPTGPSFILFSTPVSGAEVAKHIKFLPALTFYVADTLREARGWQLEARLKPHMTYAMVADTALRDVFGQPLTGNPAVGLKTTGYEPGIEYSYGRLVVERTNFGSLAIQSINIDTLLATVLPIPDSLEALWVSQSAWGYRELWERTLKASPAAVQRIPVPAPKDRGYITKLRLPVVNMMALHTPTLYAVKVAGRPSQLDDRDHPVALIQVTDLAVHARVGVEEAMVWVTGVEDGKARAGAAVTLYDAKGKAVAKGVTNAQGLVKLSGFRGGYDTGNSADDEERYSSFEGYVAAALGPDRAVTAVSQYDSDLNPWHFNVSAAYQDARYPRAGAVFTERGIYRPGETVYAKAIARDGPLGALVVPPRGDSLRWTFKDREDGTIKVVTTSLSPFGTAQQKLAIPANAALGYYALEVERKHGGKWQQAARTNYRVAEYRPPEFLVQLSRDSVPKFPGDTLRPVVQARYLFGAPMGRAVVSWSARQSPMYWVDIPNTDGFTFGDNGSWWEEYEAPETHTITSGNDTLDLTGHAALAIGLPVPDKGRAAMVTVEAAVADVNRQVVGATTTAVVHPASFYVGAKPTGNSWFWSEGTPVTVDVIAVRTDGTRIPGVSVAGTIVRREWHQVRRERDGISELVGDWVSDTVTTCSITTAATPIPCKFTPKGGGEYTVTLRSKDERGREAVTSFERWATGKDWVPWYDESQFKMDVIPDKTHYSVGDTAHVLFASPFVNAEAWITVEREGIIEQRRLTLTSGATRLDFPITEKFAPNVFISILVARGRSAPPGKQDDPGRPTIRVGYAELRVTPEVKRLAVTVQPMRDVYGPGDSASVKLLVRDVQGKGRRAEVTLWAVDEGVLSLTGYKTPDPIALLYAPRGLGMRLASNMVAVAPQVPEGLKGRLSPGGGGGRDASGVLRSQFKTTAFFMGSVITDTLGNATATAKLPDNLTTFRVMAVAVTAGDRYGSGESPMLVTRPLLARPALPRFVRNADQFAAGVVVNQRAGGTPTVRVDAHAQNIAFTGDSTQQATLEAGRGREVRFGFRAQPGTVSIGGGTSDSASFRFGVSDGKDSDAVLKRIPIKPEYDPRSYMVSGVLRDTATAVFTVPSDIDAERSRLTLSVGTSPLAVIRAAWWQLRVYPYDCTEQVSSEARVVLALFKAQQALGKSAAADSLMRGNPRAEIVKAVGVLSARQRTDGGIGYWSATDWTTPWLSAYAASVLVDAKAQGISVDDSVMARLANYLRTSMLTPKELFVPVSSYYDRRSTSLGDQVAAADILSRMGKPETATENSLLRSAPQMSYEDRLRLAEMFARRKDLKSARELLAPAWAQVVVEGRTARLPDSIGRYFYFWSRTRPMARLLVATLAVDPTNKLVPPIVETLAQIGRPNARFWYWNTQDLAWTVTGLAAFEEKTAGSPMRHIRVRAGTGSRVLLDVQGRTATSVAVVRPGAAAPAAKPSRAPKDTTISLRGLLGPVVGEERRITLTLDTPGDSSGGVAYYFLTVTEVPLTPPVKPDEAGIQVDRWYENYATGKPVTSVVEGDLVRVRLRITVPTEREFVVLDDALPGGLEAVDLSLATSTLGAGPGAAPVGRNEAQGGEGEGEEEGGGGSWWYYGWWDGGWWSPFDHREMRDDRVVYFATELWKGSWTATYIARATTPGVFIRPPAHAEEMYNPSVHGRSDGGVFTVTAKAP
jgi:uncharacterized protein YfaS (alpha-2-macroglobulin family)